MTVKELITELLDVRMDAKVKIKMCDIKACPMCKGPEDITRISDSESFDGETVIMYV